MHGHAGAAQNFGIMHVTGKGVERDVLLAKTLLEFAIGAGVEAAMFHLGLWLMREKDLRDCATAAMWATLSVRHRPDGKGASLLAALTDFAGAEVVAAGQALAAEWQRQPRGLTILNRDDSDNVFAAIRLDALTGGNSA